MTQKCYLISRNILLFIIIISIISIVVFNLPKKYTPEQIAEQVKKIHNTKITMDHVLGTNLPPRPKDPNKTIEGYDVNNNGIRDDIELDIFEAYPNSQKTRAVLLQYALVRQMELTQPINKETVTSVSEEVSRAYRCVSAVLPLGGLSDELYDFIEKRHENTSDRKRTRHDFYEGNLDNERNLGGKCDIDLSLLAN